MLKRLRRQFILIVMALVGAVLVAVLGSTYLTTYRTQQDIIDNALQRSVRGDLDERPMLGGRLFGGDRDHGGLLALVVEVSNEGIVLRSSDSPVLVNTTVLNEVIARVISDGEESGSDHDAHVAWTSLWIDDEELRIALVDTSASEELLRNQAIKDLQIVVVALTALFAITWWLSDWALRPVEQAWDQQRRFVADASHELKTPLAVILANTQILQGHEGVSTDAMRWVDSTADEAVHMKALVNDLLQLARADETAAGMSAGGMRHETVDFSEMVESSALEFDAVAFERGCTLETEVQEGIQVTGDPEWLERLVRILIDNACKYGAQGTEVRVRLARSGSHATLSVHNQGNAIDPQDLPHVFERFYRSDKTRTRTGEGGFGLGLAIAKGITEAHGGSIAVTSSQAAGTTFTVSL